MTIEEYQQAARHLARDATMPRDVAARMEQRLERAWPSAAPPVRSWEPAPPRRHSLLAAAAAVLIAAGSGLWYAGRQPAVTPHDVTKASTAREAGLPASTSDKSHPKVEVTDGGRSGSAGVRRAAERNRRKKLPPVIRPQGFVAIPTAAGLPRFESGVIVRMSLPVTALPSFGVDISSASGDQPVEADVLVGQDGLARAIRLVNTARSQQ